MALKTVICLSFIVFNNFFANMCQGRYKGGGGQKGAAPPKTKLLSPKLPSMPTQTFVTLAAVLKWWLFFCGNQSRPRRKVDHIGAMTFFFLDINRELGEN